MSQHMNPTRDGGYRPTAVYYEDADFVEYVRRDVAALHRRIDGRLTLVIDMYSREPIGFSLKGFKHFCNNFGSSNIEKQKIFLDMVVILEKLVSELGDKVFNEDSRRVAYRQAIEIAKDDQVELRDLPKYAENMS
ncbi:hypothetical protein [Rhizobium sp. G21]|uniref:hypothetical protein n=1 Tax=Rhizobium sp. G21 TaxID=2758439 RepID=UPI0016026343|nr:hypothetical protein [Rhizobium sp. G21]MBB1247487.1 hypothetical protein [Rhizobium sp. G21]